MESIEEWLRREGIGPRLRDLRVQAGLSGKDLAEANGWAQSKVSRIENGQQRPSEADVHVWGRACGAADLAGLQILREESRVANATFRDRMREGQRPVQKTYTELATGSSLVRHYENAFIPGPLQVPAYARRILAEMIPLQELEIDDVDAAVAERMKRAHLLYGTSPAWEFLLTETVLRLRPCPPAVMQAQLDRLQTVIGLEHVRFGIIPMSEEFATTPQNSVQVYVGEETLAVMETFIGETWYRGEEAAAFSRALDLLWKEAVEGDRARGLITDAVAALR